jgi:REP element-mobilizing transposase RayT
MNNNSSYNHRRSIRLQEYDYSQDGMYFITICTYQKQCIFGEIIEDKMILNQVGNSVKREWLKSVNVRQEINVDEWVIMPNHLHGIVVIKQDDNNNSTNLVGATDGVGATNGMGASLAPLQNQKGVGVRKPKSLSSFIAGFKASVTREIKKVCRDKKPLVWQRNYYETVIRNEPQLNHIRKYIRYNPLRWNDDPEKPSIQNSDGFIDFLF